MKLLIIMWYHDNYALPALALSQLPNAVHLQHVHQMGESPVCPTSLPPATRCQPSLYKSSSVPPVMLSSCLPPVPARLVQRIQDGLFIETGELSLDHLDSPDHFASERSTRSHSKVSSIIECFSVFIVVVHRWLHTRYQNLIMQTSMLG